MSTPSFNEILATWRTVSKSAVTYLDALTTEILPTDLLLNSKTAGKSRGSALRRIAYHYWFHLGEILAIRQMIGGKDLCQQVRDIDSETPYRPVLRPYEARYPGA